MGRAYRNVTRRHDLRPDASGLNPPGCRFIHSRIDEFMRASIVLAVARGYAFHGCSPFVIGPKGGADRGGLARVVTRVT